MGEFFSFLAVFTTEHIRASRVSVTALRAVQYAHTRYQRTTPPGDFSGRRMCLCGCGLFSGGGSGGGCTYQREGGDEIQGYWGLYKREIQLAGGMGGGGEGRLKKIYTFSLLLRYHQLREHSAGGDVCQRLLIQFVLPVLFLNPSADFIPGML